MTGILLLGPAAAHAQRWQPFASGSAFGTFDMSNVPLLAEETEGDEATDLRSAYTFTGTAGVRWLLPRNSGAVAYSVGLSTVGDPLRLEAMRIDSQDIVQGLQGTNTTRLGQWWHLNLGQSFFWGVSRVDQDLAAIGLGGLPAGGVPSDPGVPGVDGEPALPDVADPVGVDLVGGRFAMHEVPYVRNYSRVGIGYDRGLFWASGLSASFDLQHFLEDEPFIQRTREGRLVVRPLFDTYTVGGDVYVEHRPDLRHRFRLNFDSRTTWFVEHRLDPEIAARAIEERAIGTDGEADTITTQAVGGRAGWAWDFSPRWYTDVSLGAEVFFPFSDPSERRVDAVGALSVAHDVREWQLRAQLSRDVGASELGGVFATSALGAGARGFLMPRLQADLSANLSRHDVLLLVVEENLDPDLVDPRGYEGYSVNATLALTYLFDHHIVTSLSYQARQWFSDDPATRSLLSHRILVGVTVGTAGAQVGGGFGGAGGELAGSSD